MRQQTQARQMYNTTCTCTCTCTPAQPYHPLLQQTDLIDILQEQHQLPAVLQPGSPSNSLLLHLGPPLKDPILYGPDLLGLKATAPTQAVSKAYHGHDLLLLRDDEPLKGLVLPEQGITLVHTLPNLVCGQVDLQGGRQVLTKPSTCAHVCSKCAPALSVNTATCTWVHIQSIVMFNLPLMYMYMYIVHHHHPHHTCTFVSPHTSYPPPSPPHLVCTAHVLDALCLLHEQLVLQQLIKPLLLLLPQLLEGGALLLQVLQPLLDLVWRGRYTHARERSELNVVL